ncbi:cell division protein FtsQ, partial [Acidovorax cattleyae]|nr:cell division protein FtsQ [Paracidovorax cattleyae]
RTKRFVRTVARVAAQYGRRPDALESADLRHPDGYALRLRGVTTVEGDGPRVVRPAVRRTPPRNR